MNPLVRVGQAWFGRARAASAAPPPDTLGAALALGAIVVAVSDALALPWGHHPDWSSPTWWAWQAAVSFVVGTSLGAIAWNDLPRTYRQRRAPATLAGAWRLHRLTGRLTHEVSVNGMRPGMAAKDMDERRVVYAAQLASPVTTRDPVDGEGPEALRLAYVILTLCRGLKVDIARSVALSTQSGGVADGMAEVRKAVDPVEDKAEFYPFFRGFYLDHHAYWETAVLSVSRELAEELDPMLVKHLADTHWAVWLAVTGRCEEPFVACAGIEAHAREETRIGRSLIDPHVEAAAEGWPIR